MKASTRQRALDAATRFQRVVYRIRREADEAPFESARLVAGYEAEELLRAVLFAADVLVPALNDDASEELERYARELHKALRAHRIAQKLAAVEGRTAEETATFRAASKRLSEGKGR